LQPNFGGTWITSWATSISRDPSRNASKWEELEVNYQEYLSPSSSKNHQIEAVSEGLLEQDHQAKRHKVLIRDIQQESLKEMPPKLLHGNSKKRLRKSPKRKNGKNTNKP
jgi:Txe/YoeB family toxin of Txe-Axe toxin-antitoxin module